MDDCCESVEYYLIMSVTTNDGSDVRYTNGKCKNVASAVEKHCEVINSRWGDVEFVFSFSSSIVQCI